MIELWTEKYRPDSLTGYIFKNSQQLEQVKSWIESGNIPHLLFSGHQGTGKTTLAKLLLKQLNVDPGDILEINASQNSSVNDVRDKIINFASTFPLGEFKAVLLDECDYMSPTAQGILRGVLEKYAGICRFILTCNYSNKIIPAIHSRCQGFHFDTLDKIEFTSRVAEILLSEKIKFDLDVLDEFVEVSYPDLRKCINLVQQHSQHNTLSNMSSYDNSGTSDYMLEMLNLFKEGKILEARKLITTKAPIEEYNNIYRFMYTHLNLWGDTNDKQNQAILVIADRLKGHVISADPEINLAACLVELEQIRNV